MSYDGHPVGALPPIRALKRETPSTESLAKESSVKGVIDELPAKLNRYAKAKARASLMSDYIRSAGGSPQAKLSAKVQDCGSFLLFRNYYTVDQVRLTAANFCEKHLLCPLCAIRRGAKQVNAYLTRFEIILAQNPNLKPYLVTLTVRNGADLQERFSHLQTSIKRYNQQRRNALKGQTHVQAALADGAVWSVEFKRGEGSGLWHPHCHAIWLCEVPPNQESLSQEWLAVTGDSFIVDVRPFSEQQDLVKAFCEVFKYAIKFGELPLRDNWEAYQVLSGRRLIGSFGSFRGVQVPDDLTDEPLDADLPYIEILYNYSHGNGYVLSGATS